METIRSELGFSIRECVKRKDTLVKYDVKSLQKWIESLPMANIGEVSRLLFQVLTEFNSTQLNHDVRNKCLTVIENINGYVGSALRKHYLGHSVALNEKQRKISSLAEALDSEMAIGYKTVLDSAAKKNFIMRDKKLIANSAYRAMLYLSQVIVRCFQLYTNPPENVWKEVHQIFAYCYDNGYHKLSIEIEGKHRKQSIERLYLKLCLLTLINPYQLRQKDIEHIFSSLDELIGMIYLEETDNIDDEYIIDLSTDAPPTYHDISDASPPAEDRILKINTHDLVAYLEEHLRRVPEDSSQLTAYTTFAFNPIILRHLIVTLGKTVSRSFSRTAADGKLDVAIGLAATHYLITETTAEDEDAEEEDHYADEEIYGNLKDADIEGYDYQRHHQHLVDDDNQFMSKNDKDDDPWGKVHASTKKDAAESKKDKRFSGGEKKLSYNLIESKIINCSPGGYCLMLKENIPQQTETGEIIGIYNSDDSPAFWSLATIRWMKSNSDNTLQLGVQLIAPRVYPVYSQVKDSRIDSETFQRSLLIPAVKGLGQPQTILTPPVPYRVGHRVRFTLNDEENSIKLSKLVHSSHSYKQFEFDTLTAPSVAAPSTKTNTSPDSKNKDDDSFDSVWDLL